ncbi:hypothetical protein [Desulfonatronovibrio magnus]|uniref:hypothetical protein n=1 Tax=Desulfonatronovibrio magnus TaxID=698827 RepID=UPI0005EB9964|nr:hypothetical protein [Desulfonatronovibrio magnus]
MKRRLGALIKNNLAGSSLWLNKIKQDCVNGEVFLAIRDNRIDMYHKGGKLFGYDRKGFKTHLKYASVISHNGSDYLTEKELSDYKLASDFEENYQRIKENCSNYSGYESEGVSRLYHKHSYLSNSKVVVLDIEISFSSTEDDNTHDRIDLLLFNIDTKSLQFVEAKHFSNKEIWSKSTPKVVRQINRYESQLAKSKISILSEYANYVDEINNIFNLSLPKPETIDDKVTLLIFGFDRDQKNGRLKKLVIDNSAYSGIKMYSIGNIKEVVPENIWKCAQVL